MMIEPSFPSPRELRGEALAAAVELCSHAAVWTNAEERIIGCNAAFLRLIEQPGRRVEGQPFRSLLPLAPTQHASDTDQAPHPLDRLTPNEPQLSGSYIFTINGRPFHLQLNGQCLSADSRRTGMVLMLHRASSSRSGVLDPDTLFKAIEQSASMVIITDRNGLIEYVNPRFSLVTGYLLREVAGRNPRFLKSGATPPEAYIELWKSIKSGKNWVGELQNKAKTGRNFWVTTTISPVLHSDGTITHFVAIQEDITERKRADAALRESERRFADLINDAPDPIILLDPLGRLQHINPAAEAASGYHAHELVGKHFAKLNVVHQKSMPRVFREFGLVLAGRHREPFEIHILRKDGVLRIFEANPRLFTRHGLPFEIQIIFRDITKHKLAEQRLQTAYNELKRTQQQLLHSEKMASLGQLAAGVVHEINNPVSYILLGLQASAQLWPEILRLADTSETSAGTVNEVDSGTIVGAPAGTPSNTPDMASRRSRLIELLRICREYFTQIQDGAEHVRVIVDNLKRYAHPAGDDLTDTDLNEQIEHALVIAKHEYKHKVKLVKELSPLQPVHCHANQLLQVFVNLIVNAAQAIEGSGTITLGSKIEQDSVVFKVSDTGIGISKEQMPRLFTPFYTTKPEGVGTGLGLAICQRIIHAHGGTIRVESEPGKGSTFIVTLPYKTAPK